MKGSTKVFRTRIADRVRASNVHLSQLNRKEDVTVQKLSGTITSGSCLVLLPDPVTCFSGASYSQVQTFHLEADATLCLLDWYTSGRMTRGEEWAFERYRSVNEVWVEGKRVARDVMLLEETRTATYPLAPRSLKNRMAPYSCYATILLFGPLVRKTIAVVEKEVDGMTQFQQASPSELVWSYSPLEHGGILRAAGTETEVVKRWLKRILAPLVDVVGPEAFDKTFI